MLKQGKSKHLLWHNYRYPLPIPPPLRTLARPAREGDMLKFPPLQGEARSGGGRGGGCDSFCSTVVHSF